MSISSISGSSASLSLAEMIAQQTQKQQSGDTDEMAEFIINQDDADGDGLLSIEETPLDEDRFAEIDTDSDGFISQEELSASAQNGAQESQSLAGALNSAGSGSESDSEESSEEEEEYDTYDLNEDGVVSLDELLQAFQQGDNSLESLFGDSENGVSAMTQKLAMAAYEAQAAE